MKRAVILLLVIFLLPFELDADAVYIQIQCADSGDQVVILMHGLRGSSRSMQKMQQTLLNNGFHVITVDYPSVDFTIPELAEMTIGPALQKAEECGATRVHFVTHSLSSLMLRYYLQNHDCPNVGSIIMLSPPNHGSELIAPFEEWKWFQKFNGPAGMQLDAEGEFIKNLAEPTDANIGIIMSDFSLHPFMSMILPGNDDGRVTVESAKLQNMNEFIVVHRTHHYLMKSRKVIRLVLNYLTDGHFKP